MTAIEPTTLRASTRSIWSRLRRRKLALIGLFLVAATFLGAIFAPWLTPYEPNTQMFDGLTMQGAPMPPSAQFPLGTELLGRDRCCQTNSNQSL